MACTCCGNIIGYGAVGVCESCVSKIEQGETQTIASIVEWLVEPNVDQTDVRDLVDLVDLQALAKAIECGEWRKQK